MDLYTFVFTHLTFGFPGNFCLFVLDVQKFPRYKGQLSDLFGGRK